MRRQIVVVLFALGLVAAGPAAFWQDDGPPPELNALRSKLLAEWPKRLVPPIPRPVLDKMRADAGSGALPSPSLKEPFEIGEALNDPGRVEDAVVSMLALMNIGIVPQGTPMSRVMGRERLKVTEAEVRSLIALATADALSADAPSFTFTDVHRALSAFLPGVSVEQMAARYTKVYESREDSLVPQLLQGRPIEPDAALLRTHLWLLLADGVVRTRPDKGENVPPVAWGHGILQPDWRAASSPQFQFSDAEWEELALRLPLFVSSDLASVTPNQPRAHGKHDGKGATVQVEARLRAAPPAIVSSLTGRTLVSPDKGSLAGLDVTWQYAPNLLEHGSMSVAQAEPVKVGADGVARLVFDPNDEAANGRGRIRREQGQVEALVRADVLLGRLYNIPVAAKALAWGDRRVAGVDFIVESHVADGSATGAGDANVEETLHVELMNAYSARILGTLQRDGVDIALGTLEQAWDGTFRGEFVLFATPVRTVLPGKDCRHALVQGVQFADVIGTRIEERDSPGQMQGGFYSAVRQPNFFQWDFGKPLDYLRLEFFPKSPPLYLMVDASGSVRQVSRPPCEDEIGGPLGPNGRTPNFIPLNAAQWTVEHAGYSMAIPAEAQELAYRDLTNSKAFAAKSGIAGAIAKLAGGTDATWHVIVRRVVTKR